MIKEHDSVVLTADLPSAGLVSGDVGIVVHTYEDEKAYEVEFIAFDGNTVAVETLEAEKIRPIRSQEMPHVRDMVAA